MAIATIVLLVLLLILTTLLAAAVGKLVQWQQETATAVVSASNFDREIVHALNKLDSKGKLLGAEIQASKASVDALAQKVELTTEGSAAANVRLMEVQKALAVLHKLYVEQQDLLVGVGQLVVNTNQLTRMSVAGKSDEQVH